MSQFIVSYFKTIPQKKTKMKFYSDLHAEPWSVHLLPFLDFYFDAHSPHSHKRLFKDGIHGLYFSLTWLKWTLTIGIHKTII